MIERPNEDGSTTWIPEDLANGDYLRILESRIDPSLEGDERQAALDAAHTQALVDAENQRLALMAPPPPAIDPVIESSIIRKLKLKVGLTDEEIAALLAD